MGRIKGASTTGFACLARAPDFLGAYAVQPPSMTSSVPVMQEDSSEARKRMPRATSSGEANRPSGVEPATGVSPDDIAARPSTEGDLGEMVQDIEGLLRRKEDAEGFPLVSLFQAIMGGTTVEEQKRRFGDRRVRGARKVIVATVEEYARSSGNHALVNLLWRMTGEIDTPRRVQVPAARPMLSDKERDFASIASVIARYDRPVGSADLGRYRRRWLEYGPRDAASGHRNRLEEVLAAMVRDGVLRATRTAGGATVYGPGPNFEAYRQQGAGV